MVARAPMAKETFCWLFGYRRCAPQLAAKCPDPPKESCSEFSKSGWFDNDGYWYCHLAEPFEWQVLAVRSVLECALACLNMLKESLCHATR